jgi:hypothetical protein
VSEYWDPWGFCDIAISGAGLRVVNSRVSSSSGIFGGTRLREWSERWSGFGIVECVM